MASPDPARGSSRSGGSILSSEAIERSRHNAFLGAAALVSATNDPRSEANKTGWFGLKAPPDNSWKDPPPPLDSWKYPEVTVADLQRYLQIVGNGRVEQFHQDRESLAEGHRQQLLVEGQGGASVPLMVLILTSVGRMRPFR